MSDQTIAEAELVFDGERFIPGQGSIDMAVEHSHRYLYARSFVQGKRVLDVGCGVGYGSVLMEGYDSYTGIDLGEETIRVAQRRFAGSTVAFEVSDVVALDFPNDSFDVVVSFELLEHVSHPPAVMSEIARVLKPAGLALVSMPDKFEYNRIRVEPNPFHPSEMTPLELEAMLGKDFQHVLVMGQKYCRGSVVFPSGDFAKNGEVFFPPDWVGPSPVPEYLVAAASQQELPQLPASGMFLTKNDQTQDLKAALQAADERELSTQDLKVALQAADGRELMAARQLQVMGEELFKTQAALQAADEREFNARRQLQMYEEKIEGLALRLSIRR